MEHTSQYIGRQIGNYRIERQIASGGFGTVFLAQHIHLNQRLAVIKLLHSVRLNSDEERTQFMQEAQILDTLRGLPHILPILDFGIEPGGHFPYMIAEYAERGSLRARIKQQNGPLPLPVALDILAQVGRGLQAAHDQHIVHRDMKPENILFNGRAEALLADFGLSTVLTTTSMKQTDVAGSPAYMAPEQFRGRISKESDQYSLACIAYELLAGRRPFQATDFLAMGFLHTSELPAPPKTYNSQLPDYVDQAIVKAMAKDRTARFPDIKMFIEALQSSNSTYRVTNYATPPPPSPSSPPAPPFPVQVDLKPSGFSYNKSGNIYGAGTDIPYGRSGYPSVTTQNQTAGYDRMTNPYASSSPYVTPPVNRGDGAMMAPLSTPVPQGISNIPHGQMPYWGMPAQEDPFLTLSASMRILAALSYLFSPFALFFSIPLYVIGSKNYFARFHLMQSLLFWVSNFVLLLILYWLSGGSTEYDSLNPAQETWTCVLGLWAFAFPMLLLSLTALPLMKKTAKFPPLGQLADKYANRGRLR